MAAPSGIHPSTSRLEQRLYEFYKRHLLVPPGVPEHAKQQPKRAEKSPTRSDRRR